MHTHGTHRSALTRIVRVVDCAALLLFLPVIVWFAVWDARLYRQPFRSEMRAQWAVWKRGWRVARRGG